MKNRKYCEHDETLFFIVCHIAKETAEEIIIHNVMGHTIRPPNTRIVSNLPNFIQDLRESC